jgi:hypothetical protein
LRPKRFGIMTMLAEKRQGKWLAIATQNTDAASQPAPEASDIIFISLPRRVEVAASAPETRTSGEAADTDLVETWRLAAVSSRAADGRRNGTPDAWRDFIGRASASHSRR